MNLRPDSIQPPPHPSPTYRSVRDLQYSQRIESVYTLHMIQALLRLAGHFSERPITAQ